MKKQNDKSRRALKDLKADADVKGGGLSSACCTGQHYSNATIVVR